MVGRAKGSEFHRNLPEMVATNEADDRGLPLLQCVIDLWDKESGQEVERRMRGRAVFLTAPKKRPVAAS